MVRATDPGNRKILVIDHDPAVHATISHLLKENPNRIEHDASASNPNETSPQEYLVISTDNGLTGVRMAIDAEMSGKPFAVAFVGETGAADLSSSDAISRIRQDCPDMEIVALIPDTSDGSISAPAISSYPGQFLVLRKSFGGFEIGHLVQFLTGKWDYRNTVRQTYEKMCLDQNRRLAELENTNLRLQQEIIIQGRRQEIFQDKFVRYRNLFDNADCPLIVTSGKRKRPAGKILDVNQRLCQLCDYTSAELKNMRFEDVFDTTGNVSDSSPILSGLLKTRASENIPAEIRSRSITIGQDSVVVSAAFVSVPLPVIQ